MKINVREEYVHTHPELTIDESPVAPSELFNHWYTQAHEDNPHTANIMTLATIAATPEHLYPTTRIVLLREYADNHYIFYTHYTSAKGEHVFANPHVALNFYWHNHHRQLRINGLAKRLSAEASDTYFKSRPFSSQVAAVMSKQSEPLAHYQTFKNDIAQLAEKYHGRETDLKRPQTWGGIIVHAHYYEFWQGRPSRIHERLVYRRTDTLEHATASNRSSPPPTTSPSQVAWQKMLLYP